MVCTRNIMHARKKKPMKIKTRFAGIKAISFASEWKIKLCIFFARVSFFPATWNFRENIP